MKQISISNVIKVFAIVIYVGIFLSHVIESDHFVNYHDYIEMHAWYSSISDENYSKLADYAVGYGVIGYFFKNYLQTDIYYFFLYISLFSVLIQLHSIFRNNQPLVYVIIVATILSAYDLAYLRLGLCIAIVLASFDMKSIYSRLALIILASSIHIVGLIFLAPAIFTKYFSSKVIYIGYLIAFSVVGFIKPLYISFLPLKYQFYFTDSSYIDPLLLIRLLIISIIIIIGTKYYPKSNFYKNISILFYGLTIILIDVNYAANRVLDIAFLMLLPWICSYSGKNKKWIVSLMFFFVFFDILRYTIGDTLQNLVIYLHRT
ncbi:hypothetical protein G6710_02030 [Polynucleobacter paneuropaeus]|nr:hypothetical protein [Polynucleobacter paneuropaeus]